MNDSDTIRLFISYARADRVHCDELYGRLKSLPTICPAFIARDSEIRPGDIWRREISAAIEAADVVVLLVSDSFCASEYCADEGKQAADRQPSCRLIPVFIEPLHDALGQYIKERQGAHVKSLAEVENKSEWWNDVVHRLSKVASEILSERRVLAAQREAVRAEAQRALAVQREAEREAQQKVLQARHARELARRGRWQLLVYGFAAPLALLGVVFALSFRFHRTRAGHFVVWPRWRSIEIFEAREGVLSTLSQPVAHGADILPIAIREAGRGERLVAATAMHAFGGVYWLQAHEAGRDFLKIAHKTRPIGVVVPSRHPRGSHGPEDRAVPRPGPEACESLAGLTLDAGAELFEGIPGSRLQLVRWYDEGKPRNARPIIEDFKRKGVVAVVGTYESRVTDALMGECGISARRAAPSGAWPRSDCGPMLTLSSAVSLRGAEQRASTGDIPWLFRMTVNNQVRAAALADAIQVETEKQPSGMRDVYIIYKDDVERRGEVGYALDQAYHLSLAFRQIPVSLKLVSFRREKGAYKFVEDPRLSAEGDAIVSSGGRRVEADDFGTLIGEMLTGASSTVAFVALDTDIIAFARALHESRKTAAAQVRLYVPGPREVFEHAWGPICFGGSYLEALEGVRVVSPDDGNASYQNYIFLGHWRGRFSAWRASSRAARIYDSLTVVERAIDTLDTELKNGRIAEVQRDLYRVLLRNTIAREHYIGASGLIDFDATGDISGPAYLKELQSAQLRPLSIYDLLPPALEQEPAPPPRRGARGLGPRPAAAPRQPSTAHRSTPQHPPGGSGRAASAMDVRAASSL